jgi:cold shock CspA family protein
MQKDLKGKVKWFSQEKGYGFINLIGTEADYFCHRNNLLDKDLIKDEIVLFDEKENYAKGGVMASNVRRISYVEMEESLKLKK